MADKDQACSFLLKSIHTFHSFQIFLQVFTQKYIQKLFEKGDQQSDRSAVVFTRLLIRACVTPLIHCESTSGLNSFHNVKFPSIFG